MLTTEKVRYYISKSLGLNIQSILEIREIRNRFGRELLDCLYCVNGGIEQRILKLYHKGFEDVSEIGAVNVARKVHLASIELAARYISIPRVFGSYLSDEIACVVMEKLKQTERKAEKRETAAMILARLHNVSPDYLSDDFQILISDSKPNKDRGRTGLINLSRSLDKNHPQWRADHPGLSERLMEIVQNVEPVSSMRALVHGDYFPENLIHTSDGLYVIDWDALALGDPMWDLGMLIGSDEGISEKEISDVIRAYQCTRQIDEKVLRWHITCWRSTLGLFKLKCEYSTQPDIQQ